MLSTDSRKYFYKICDNENVSTEIGCYLWWTIITVPAEYESHNEL